MKKMVRYATAVVFSLTLSFLLLLVFSFYTVPDEIYSVSDEEIRVNDFFTVTFQPEDAGTRARMSDTGSYNVKISLFNAIPVKNSSLTVTQRRYVNISGEIIGLRLFTQGVMLVGIDYVETPQGSLSPGTEAGLVKGDVIFSINGIQTDSSSKVNELISQSGGKVLELVIIRAGERLSIPFTPAYSLSEQKYKGGLWVRDSAAGIGTMTCYDGETGFFAALGHAVCDIDTGEVLPLADGDIVSAEIMSCNKGTNGKAGELCGSFTSESIGVLMKNSEQGLFGLLNYPEKNGRRIPVATENEIKKGKAQILSTVDSAEAQYYDIEILKISMDDSHQKNMVIRVTDEALIEKTGGIVQGMSGSPIVQDGRLVGAVTHVLVGDPTKGYGIFIGNMLKAAENYSDTGLSKAS